MNTSKIYSDAVGRTQLAELHNANQAAPTHDQMGNPISPEQKQKDKQEQDIARKQMHHSWMQSTVTAELLKSLNEEYTKLVAEAVSNSLAYPQTKNHDLVIHKLVRAHQVQELVRQIVTTKTPN